MTEYLESEVSRAATAGTIQRRKSGWNRLFLVISVLWAIGAPIWVMVDTNDSTGKVYQMCLNSAYKNYDVGGYTPNTTKYDATKSECLHSFERQFIPPQRLLAMLLGNDPGPGGYGFALLWGVILVPIALLWLIGGGTVRTVRWIAAGFR